MTCLQTAQDIVLRVRGLMKMISSYHRPSTANALAWQAFNSHQAIGHPKPSEQAGWQPAGNLCRVPKISLIPYIYLQPEVLFWDMQIPMRLRRWWVYMFKQRCAVKLSCWNSFEAQPAIWFALRRVHISTLILMHWSSVLLWLMLRLPARWLQKGKLGEGGQILYLTRYAHKQEYKNSVGKLGHVMWKPYVNRESTHKTQKASSQDCKHGPSKGSTTYSCPKWTPGWIEVTWNEMKKPLSTLLFPFDCKVIHVYQMSTRRHDGCFQMAATSVRCLPQADIWFVIFVVDCNCGQKHQCNVIP